MQLLLCVHAQCTWIVLQVHRDAANTKKIVNRVSLSQVVAGVASCMSRRKKLYFETWQGFYVFYIINFCALLRAQLHGPIP